MRTPRVASTRFYATGPAGRSVLVVQASTPSWKKDLGLPAEAPEHHDVTGDDERHQEGDEETQGQVQQRPQRVWVGQGQPGCRADHEQDVDQAENVPGTDQSAPRVQRAG